MSSIKKNFAYQSIYEILIILLPFVTSPYISRVLGAENLGIYTYTYSVANFFVIFSMLGLKHYGNRMIAMVREDRNELNKVFSSLFWLHALVTILVIIFYVLYLIYIVETDFVFALIQIIFVISALFDINWLFFGIEQFKLTVIRNSIIKILTVVAIFIFVNNQNDLWKYTLIMAAGSFISQSIVWMYIKKYVSFVKPDWKDVINHMKPMSVLFIPILSIVIYKYMGKIMLGNMGTKTELGFFENAERAISIPTTIITAFGTVMLPKISNLASKGDKQQIDRYMYISMQLVMCFGIGLTFGIAGVADVFAPIFWGKEFAQTGILILLLSISIPFLTFANIIRMQYLIPMQKDKMYMSSIVIGAFISVILNLFLISSYQVIGAVIAAVSAEVSVCLILMFVVRKELPLVKYISSFIFFLIPGIAMFMVVKIIEDIMQPTLICLLTQIVVGAIVFISMCLIYFFVTKNIVLINQWERIRKVYLQK